VSVRGSLVVLAISLVASACAPPSGPRYESASGAARAYGEALSSGDADGAHGLELATAHRGRDVAAQAARIADAREELGRVGRALASAGDAVIRTRARIPLESGELVVLARAADGSWRIEGGTPGAPALETPRDAIAALRSALTRRDLRALEEMLAQRSRAAWEREVERVLEETGDLDALQIVIEGDRATVTTPDGAVIELARESGEWRLVEVRPMPAP
jgi:hypothetical protein